MERNRIRRATLPHTHVSTRPPKLPTTKAKGQRSQPRNNHPNSTDVPYPSLAAKRHGHDWGNFLRATPPPSVSRYPQSKRRSTGRLCRIRILRRVKESRIHAANASQPLCWGSSETKTQESGGGGGVSVESRALSRRKVGLGGTRAKGGRMKRRASEQASKQASKQASNPGHPKLKGKTQAHVR